MLKMETGLWVSIINFRQSILIKYEVQHQRMDMAWESFRRATENFILSLIIYLCQRLLLNNFFLPSTFLFENGSFVSYGTHYVD